MFVLVSVGVGVSFILFFIFLSFQTESRLISMFLIVEFSCKAMCFMTTKLKFF